MRVLVISDVHGKSSAMAQAIEEQPSARDVLFLGDGLREAQDVADRFPDRRFYMVPGNCDFAAPGPFSRLEFFGNKRFFFTHGHKYNVKYDLYTLEQAAKEQKADVVLFGHTHVPYEEYDSGMYYLNPGSLGYLDTYGYVDVTASGIMTGIVHLR